MTNTTEFSTRSFHKILKSETDRKVSKDAADTLAEEIESKAEKIAAKSYVYAQRDGRVTVRREDVKKALKEVRRQ